MEFKKSKTLENLKAGFAGESQANRRYLYFSLKADEEGQQEISQVFRSTADGETAHAIGALAGIDASLLSYDPLINSYTTLYESDYANQNSRHKYMFLYETSNYYYPWYVVDAQSSSFGVNGILSNGNTNTIIPIEDWLGAYVPIPGGPAAYAQYVSDCSNSFGTGQWKYVGS